MRLLLLAAVVLVLMIQVGLTLGVDVVQWVAIAASFVAILSLAKRLTTLESGFANEILRETYREQLHGRVTDESALMRRWKEEETKP